MNLHDSKVCCFIFLNYYVYCLYKRLLFINKKIEVSIIFEKKFNFLIICSRLITNIHQNKIFTSLLCIILMVGIINGLFETIIEYDVTLESQLNIELIVTQFNRIYSS